MMTTEDDEVSWKRMETAPKLVSILSICERERADGKKVQYFAVIKFDPAYGLWRDEYYQIHWPMCWMPLPDRPFALPEDRQEPYRRLHDNLDMDALVKVSNEAAL